MSGKSSRRLILVKHAQPAIRRDVPAAEWLLSETGQDQCQGLASALRSFEPTAVYASREPKAAETGAIVARELELPYATAEGLHEHARTSVEFMAPDMFQESVRRLLDHPDELVFGEETANDAASRFSSAVDAVVNSDCGDCPVIVAHGTVISLYVAGREGSDPYPLWQRLGLPSIVVLSLPDRSVEHIEEEVA